MIPFQQLQMPGSQAPKFAKTHGWASWLAWVVALTVWTGVGIPLLQKWRQSKSRVHSVEKNVEKSISVHRPY